MKQKVALIHDARYLEHNPGDGHPESPDRLRAVLGLIEKEFRHLPRISPRYATPGELALIHDPAYIARVAQTQGKPLARLDPDTGTSARSYEVARLAAGGLLAAVDAILAPREPGPLPLSSVFAFVRPPGHHACYDRGMGFCLFNNVAIAAEYARAKYGLKRILIVDWDLHHGNGTQDAFYSDPGVLFFSSHQSPYYPGSGNYDECGAGAGEGFTVNAPLPAGFGDPEFIEIYSRILKPIALEYRPELVLVSAGFDPYIRDPLGGLKVTGAGFGRLAQILLEIAGTACEGKMIFSLEGGYHPDGLREGVEAVLSSLMGRQQFPVVRPVPHQADELMKKIIQVQKKYWDGLL